MKTTIGVLAILLLVSLTMTVQGQGCSDAGFCTINSFKPNEMRANPETNNQFKIGISYGKADRSISALANYLEYNGQINEKLSIDAKLTSISQNGNDISSWGLSDLFLNTNYFIAENSVVTFGTKIPLSTANKSKNGLPLPMDYQGSLGTFDLILGLGYEIGNTQLLFALQQPLSQNKNEFLAEEYPENSALRNFQSTNKFKRSGDILARISYPITITNGFQLTPSLLPVYHLSNDKYTDASGIEQEIEGSNGLTLNTNAYFDYEINVAHAIQLNVGFPLIVRDIRPDGLTRSFIATLEYKIRF